MTTACVKRAVQSYRCGCLVVALVGALFQKMSEFLTPRDGPEGPPTRRQGMLNPTSSCGVDFVICSNEGASNSHYSRTSVRVKAH